MQNKKPNAELAWKQLEDIVVPNLRLTVNERAAYAHLFRHTRLEGRSRSRISVSWLARGLRVNANTARLAIRRLAAKGALRILARTYRGHLVEVPLPEEMCRARVPGASQVVRLEKADFLTNPRLRAAIHRREAGRCFYCLREVSRGRRCLDHVVPAVSKGSNSYRNLVSCCQICNVQKAGKPAADYLRSLFRMRRLSARELNERFRALRALATGKLKPVLREDQRANGPFLQQRSAKSNSCALTPTDARHGKPSSLSRGRPRKRLQMRS